MLKSRYNRSNVLIHYKSKSLVNACTILQVGTLWSFFFSKKFINHIIESRDVIVSFRLSGALVKVDSDGSIGVIVFVEAWKLKWLKSEDIKSK